MSVPALRDGPVRRVERRATRAVVQRAVSHVVIVGLLVATIVTVRDAVTGEVGGSAPEGAGLVALPLVSAEDGSGTDEGRMLGATLRAVDAALRRTSARLVTLTSGRPDGRMAPIVLEVDVRTGAEGLTTVLDALGRSGIVGAVPRRVVPTAEGVRASIHGDTVLSVARLAGSARDGRALAVRLAEDVERAGLVLRHLDVLDAEEDVVRLEVEGAIEFLADTVLDIERHHTAPVRVAGLELRMLDEDRGRLSMVFHPRGDRG